MRERRRKHDDAHYPLQGRGKRATPRKKPAVHPAVPMCDDCGKFPNGMTHLCDQSRARATGKPVHKHCRECIRRIMNHETPWCRYDEMGCAECEEIVL